MIDLYNVAADTSLIPMKHHKSVHFTRNYQLMTREELIDSGVVGSRLSLAMKLRAKCFDILSIIMIALYAFLIFIYIAIEDIIINDGQMIVFYAIELFILTLFAVEISLNLASYWRLYLEDGWNIFDCVIITLCFIFVFLDIFVDN